MDGISDLKSVGVVEFYTESGNLNAAGLMATYLVCLIAAMGLGYVYAVIIFYNPFFYFNVLACFGFGFLLGLIPRIMARITHNRNPKSRLVLAIVTGILGLLFQWSAYLYFLYTGEIQGILSYISNLYWLVLPQNTFPVIAEIYQKGLWSLFGIQFNGPVLAIIWLIEAAILIILPLRIVLQMKPAPYSENQLKWYPKYTLQKNFAPVFGGPIELALHDDAYEALAKMGPGMGNRHGKAHLYILENEEYQYISFDNVHIDPKGKKQVEQFIAPVRILNSNALTVMKRFDNQREKADVF